MRKLNGEEIFSIMSDLDPALLSEAMPPSWVGKGSTKRHPLRTLGRWLQTGWAAAILSVVVAVGVVSAIIIAGRPGVIDSPAGSQPVTEEPGELPSDVEAYSLRFISHGDGTCTVELLAEDSVTAFYSAVIPKASPAGDTVVAVSANFNNHDLLPRVLTPADYETYILRPMEAYFGITLAEAEAIQDDTKHPDAPKGFELRRYLAYYAFKTAEALQAEPNRPQELYVRTDCYVLEYTLTDEERMNLYALFVDMGMTAEKLEAINRSIRPLAEYPDSFPAEINTSAGLTSLRLPAGVQSVTELAFDLWPDLEQIVFDGTMKQWLRAAGDAWSYAVKVRCSDGTLYPINTDSPEGIADDTISLLLPEDVAIFIPGNLVHSVVWADGKLQTEVEDTYPHVTELANHPLSVVSMPVGTSPGFVHFERSGWTYTTTMRVYDVMLKETGLTINNSTLPPEALSELSAGTYYVQLSLHGLGPVIPEVSGSESTEHVFYWILQVKGTTDEPEMPDGIDPTAIAMDLPYGETVHLRGEALSGHYMENGEHVEFNASSLSVESYVQYMPVATVSVLQDMPVTIRHYTREGWTYDYILGVGCEDLSDFSATGPADLVENMTLSDRAIGTYYVELTVIGNGPTLEEIGEQSEITRYIFRMNVKHSNPASPGEVLSFPTASGYVGEMHCLEDIYDFYPAWAGTEFRWRVEKRLSNGLFVEELACPDQTFTLDGGGVDGSWAVMREPEYHYYVHFTVYENGDWCSVGYCVIEVAVDE